MKANERERFERYAKDMDWDIARSEDGYYVSAEMNDRWALWMGCIEFDWEVNPAANEAAAVPARQDAEEIPVVDDWVHEDDCPCFVDQCSIDCKNCTCEKKCEVPPAGWRCTRERGHDGPCAALPDYSAPARQDAVPDKERADMDGFDVEGIRAERPNVSEGGAQTAVGESDLPELDVSDEEREMAAKIYPNPVFFSRGLAQERCAELLCRERQLSSTLIHLELANEALISIQAQLREAIAQRDEANREIEGEQPYVRCTDQRHITASKTVEGCPSCGQRLGEDEWEWLSREVEKPDIITVEIMRDAARKLITSARQLREAIAQRDEAREAGYWEHLYRLSEQERAEVYEKLAAIEAQRDEAIQRAERAERVSTWISDKRMMKHYRDRAEAAEAKLAATVMSAVAKPGAGNLSGPASALRTTRESAEQYKARLRSLPSEPGLGVQGKAAENDTTR